MDQLAEICFHPFASPAMPTDYQRTNRPNKKTPLALHKLRASWPTNQIPFIRFLRAQSEYLSFLYSISQNRAAACQLATPIQTISGVRTHARTTPEQAICA